MKGHGDILVGWRFKDTDVRVASRHTVVLEKNGTNWRGRPSHYEPIELPAPVAGPMIRQYDSSRQKWYVICGNCHMVASKHYTRANEPALHVAARDHRCEADIPWETAWLDIKDPTTAYDGMSARPQDRELLPLERDILVRILSDIFHVYGRAGLDGMDTVSIRMDEEELRMLVPLRKVLDPRDE